MIFNIPQFIDKEDKIVGPLTGKQLGWIFLGGITVLILWATLDSQTFYVSLLPVIGLSVAFAFYRPYNQSLASFIYFTIIYFFRDKLYIWKRLPDTAMPIKKATSKKKIQGHDDDKSNSEKIDEISKLLDLKTKK